jgi:hypothetical protein
LFHLQAKFRGRFSGFPELQCPCGRFTISRTLAERTSSGSGLTICRQRRPQRSIPGSCL